MEYLKIKQITDEGYAKYGKLLKKKACKPDVDREYLKYWHDLYDVDITAEKTVGYLEIYRQDFIVNQLERHVTGPEIFNIKEGIGLMAFSPKTDNSDPESYPNEEEIEVFLLDGSVSLTIDAGVWHFPPLPITEKIGIFVTAPKYVSEDLDTKSFTAKGLIL